MLISCATETQRPACGIKFLPTRRDPAAATGDFTGGPVCLSRTCELRVSVAKQAWCHPSPSPRLAVSARQLVERRIEYRVTQPGLSDTFLPVSLRDKTEYSDNRSVTQYTVRLYGIRPGKWKRCRFVPTAP